MFVEVLPRKHVVEQGSKHVACKNALHNQAGVLESVPPGQVDTHFFPEFFTVVETVVTNLHEENNRHEGP